MNETLIQIYGQVTHNCKIKYSTWVTLWSILKKEKGKQEKTKKPSCKDNTRSKHSCKVITKSKHPVKTVQELNIL